MPGQMAGWALESAGTPSFLFSLSEKSARIDQSQITAPCWGWPLVVESVSPVVSLGLFLFLHYSVRHR